MQQYASKQPQPQLSPNVHEASVCDRGKGMQRQLPFHAGCLSICWKNWAMC